MGPARPFGEGEVRLNEEADVDELLVGKVTLGLLCRQDNCPV